MPIEKNQTVTTPAGDELLSIAQVARAYGVSPETVRRWCRKGVIAFIMVGPFRLKRIQRSEAAKHFEGPIRA